ncbi:MAG: GntR family transcriptional regulator [Ruminococcus sp.]
MDFQANYPIYLQIAEDVKRRIVIGELKPGDKLPSNAELAIAYQVNPNTVQRIYRQLEAEGISYTKRGIGTFWRKIRQCRNACGRKSAKNSAPSS